MSAGKMTPREVEATKARPIDTPDVGKLLVRYLTTARALLGIHATQPANNPN
jgi:hypothetical protein